MKKLFLYGLSGILLTFITPAVAHAVSTEFFNQGIEKIIDNLHTRAKIGIVIQSLDNGQILYQKNPYTSFIPASGLKVFTAYTALRYLGSDFKYQTQLLTDTHQTTQDGVINGNLYLKATGDPELKINDLERLIGQLKGQGIHTITGRILIDDHDYALTSIVPPGAEVTDKKYCYASPVNALILNRNCTGLTIIPAKKPGEAARLSFPQNIILPTRGAVIMDSNPNISCHPELKIRDNEPLELSGCMRPRSRATYVTVPLTDTKQYGVYTILALLARHHITVKGSTMPQKVGGTPPKTLYRLLAMHESRPLSELIHTMLKNSDNLIANSLYKKIGFHYFNQAGNWNNGGQAIRLLLQKQDEIDLSRMTMFDGAGLSHDNTLTPLQMAQLLKTAYYNPKVSNSFIGSLPISGVNGTLKYRMNTRDMIGRVKAKTGTMKGISSLSGYITTQRNKTVSFTILINDSINSASKFRLLEDRICRFINLYA